MARHMKTGGKLRPDRPWCWCRIRTFSYTWILGCLACPFEDGESLILSVQCSYEVVIFTRCESEHPVPFAPVCWGTYFHLPILQGEVSRHAIAFIRPRQSHAQNIPSIFSIYTSNAFPVRAFSYVPAHRGRSVRKIYTWPGGRHPLPYGLTWVPLPTPRQEKLSTSAMEWCNIL